MADDIHCMIAHELYGDVPYNIAKMNVLTYAEVTIHKGRGSGANFSGKSSIILHDAYMRHRALMG